VAKDQSRLGGSVLRLTRKFLPAVPTFGLVSQAAQKNSRMSANSRRWLKVLFFRENKRCLRINTFVNISS